MSSRQNFDKLRYDGQELASTNARGKLAAFQNRASARTEAKFTALEQNIHHLRDAVSFTHDQLRLCDKLELSKTDFATAFFALQNKLAGVILSLNAMLGTEVSTPGESHRMFWPTPTVLCEAYQASGAVPSALVSCITQKTADIVDEPSELVAGTDIASVLRPGLKMSAGIAAFPLPWAPINSGADLQQQPVDTAVDFTVLTPDKAAVEVETSTGRLGSILPSFGRAAY